MSADYIALHRFQGDYTRIVQIRPSTAAEELIAVAQRGDTLHKLDAPTVEANDAEALFAVLDEQFDRKDFKEI